MTLLPDFVDHLSKERRMADKTVDAYRSDLASFLGFLATHTGAEPTPKRLAALGARDIRAFLAARRRDGLADASIARLLSSIKAFYRWLDRAHDVSNAEIGYLRGPKRPSRLPRPVSVDAARDMIELADTDPDKAPWLGARDAAVLSLLYGAGLRISEALGLTGRDAPLQERLRVTGKGGKVRILPILPAVRDAVTAYTAACPYDLKPSDALFRGAKGGPLNPRIVQGLVQTLRGQLGLPATATPHALRHAFATHLLANGARPARHPDLARPRLALDHADLHRRRRRPSETGPRRRPPPGIGAPNRVDGPSSIPRTETAENRQSLAIPANPQAETRPRRFVSIVFLGRSDRETDGKTGTLSNSAARRARKANGETDYGAMSALGGEADYRGLQSTNLFAHHPALGRLFEQH